MWGQELFLQMRSLIKCQVANTTKIRIVKSNGIYIFSKKTRLNKLAIFHFRVVRIAAWMPCMFVKIWSFFFRPVTQGGPAKPVNYKVMGRFSVNANQKSGGRFFSGAFGAGYFTPFPSQPHPAQKNTRPHKTSQSAIAWFGPPLDAISSEEGPQSPHVNGEDGTSWLQRWESFVDSNP